MSNLIKILIPCLVVSACSSPEKSEAEKIRQQNAKGEYIYRKSDETFYQPGPLKKKEPEPYPWELE